MMPRRHATLATFALVTLCAGPVFAASGEEIFGRLDTDGNGSLSRAEILPLREAMFARIDADGDGALTAAEVEAAGAAAARRPADNGRLWSQDADQDGRLTLAEYTAETPGFDRADRNGDGVLSAREFSRIARFLGTASN